MNYHRLFKAFPGQTKAKGNRPVVLKLPNTATLQYNISCCSEPRLIKLFHCYFIPVMLLLL